MPKPVDTTHTIIENELLLHKPDRSRFWQCRFHVDGEWLRKSTGEPDLDKAKKKALELLYDAQVLKRMGLPVITRKFRDIAKLAIKRLEDEAANDRGLRKHRDYLIVIDKYLLPFFGNYNVTSIDYKMLP